jgi:predicted dehydrogenase
MVGFNRRFAPQVKKISSLLGGLKGPKAFVMTVNAGAVPAEHWTQDPVMGGGRILGEACHFIDLLRFLAAAPITGHTSRRMDSRTHDTVTIQLDFADGSIGTIHYLANGHKAYPGRLRSLRAGGS